MSLAYEGKQLEITIERTKRIIIVNLFLLKREEQGLTEEFFSERDRDCCGQR